MLVPFPFTLPSWFLNRVLSPFFLFYSLCDDYLWRTLGTFDSEKMKRIRIVRVMLFNVSATEPTSFRLVHWFPFISYVIVYADFSCQSLKEQSTRRYKVQEIRGTEVQSRVRQRNRMRLKVDLFRCWFNRQLCLLQWKNADLNWDFLAAAS